MELAAPYCTIMVYLALGKRASNFSPNESDSFLTETRNQIMPMTRTDYQTSIKTEHCHFTSFLSTPYVIKSKYLDNSPLQVTRGKRKEKKKETRNKDTFFPRELLYDIPFVIFCTLFRLSNGVWDAVLFMIIIWNA